MWVLIIKTVHLISLELRKIHVFERRKWFEQINRLTILFYWIIIIPSGESFIFQNALFLNEIDQTFVMLWFSRWILIYWRFTYYWQILIRNRLVLLIFGHISKFRDIVHRRQSQLYMRIGVWTIKHHFVIVQNILFIFWKKFIRSFLISCWVYVLQISYVF